MASTKVPIELSSTPGIVDNSNATAITIDSSENVGIGTSNPARELHIHDSTTDNVYLMLSNSTSGSASGDGLQLFTDGTNAGLLNRENGYLKFTTNNSDRMTIDSSGNVGIGTSSPNIKTHIYEDANSTIGIRIQNPNTGGSASSVLYFQTDTGTSRVYLDGQLMSIRNESASPDIRFVSGSTETVRIDSSGNVGIGTSSPSTTLHAYSSGTRQGKFEASGSGESGITIANSDGSGELIMGGVEHFLLRNLTQGKDLIFQTTPSGGSVTERMRIDSSGNLMVGITSVVSNATTTIYKSNLDYGLFIRKGDGTTGSTNKYIGFDISGGGTAGGSITNSSAGNAQFTATSDERLKENIKDVTGCLDKVMALKPSSYTLKQNNLDVPYGFIAQNVETVLPEFVSENEEGYKQISDGLTSGYIAVLTKAIQEQQVLIEQLQAEVALLKGE